MDTLSQITGNFSDAVKEPNSDIAEIPKDIEITGSMYSRTNIKIAGSVKGNLTSNANIMISGTVEGDISGEYISVQNGIISGNIISKTCVIVSENSVIKGDIICDKLTINGDLIGNVQVQSSATLGSLAVIHGNLTARYLSIQEGAVINGSIKVDRDNEISLDIFQIGFQIQAVAG